MSTPHRPPLRDRVPRDRNGTHHGQAEGPAEPSSRILVHQGHPGTTVTPAPVTAAGLRFQADREWAEQMARSGMLPETFRNKPENVLWAIGYAREFNIPVTTAINNIYMTKDGKPAVMTALMKGLVHRAGHKLRVTLIKPSGKLDADTHAIARLIRTDDPDFTYEALWDLGRAVQAQLIRIHPETGTYMARSQYGKPLPWELYPESMLKARAFSEVIRDGASDVMLGVSAYTPEELGANVDEEGRPLEIGDDGEGFPTMEMDEDATESALGGFDGPQHEDPEGEDLPAPGDIRLPEGPFEPSTAPLAAWETEIRAALDTCDRDALNELKDAAGQFRGDDDDLLRLFQNARTEWAAMEHNNPF